MKLLLILCGIANSRRTRKARLSNYNTGRLYMMEDWGFGFTEPYGTVCIGVKNEKLDSQFGEVVCRLLGFDSLGFCGLRPEYTKFMTQNKMKIPVMPDNQICIPHFIYAGGSCPSNATNFMECDLRSYAVEGGACLKDASELFIHCNVESIEQTEFVDEWKVASDGECTGCYTQSYRVCDSGMCNGEWLKVEACEECLKPANREYVDYNAEYERDESPGSGDYPYYSSYSSHSSESDYDSLKGPRPDVGESPRAFRRRIGRVLKNVNITERIINCKPDTFHDANINTHLPDTELFDLILEDDQPDEPTKPVTTTPETTKPDEITKPDKITKPASADQNVIVTTSETTTTSVESSETCTGSCCGCFRNRCWARCNWYLQTPSCYTLAWYKSMRESWCYTDTDFLPSNCNEHRDCENHVASCDGLCKTRSENPW